MCRYQSKTNLAPIHFLCCASLSLFTLISQIPSSFPLLSQYERYSRHCDSFRDIHLNWVIPFPKKLKRNRVHVLKHSLHTSSHAWHCWPKQLMNLSCICHLWLNLKVKSPPCFVLFLSISHPGACRHPAANQFVPVYWWPNHLKSPCDLYFSVCRSKICNCFQWLVNFCFIVRGHKTV